ncbi:hypothetical protein PIROE2DRAFT_18659, partial [Piromyces sp. E2]
MKSILILTVSLLSSLVSCKSSFFDGIKRPKLYELLDEEVGDMFITMPDEDVEKLKAAANVGYSVDDTFNDNTTMMELMASEEPDYKALSEFFKPTVSEDFKTKDASMVFKINGEEQKFSKVTFSIGGNSGSGYAKFGYNIKIRNNKKDLYGCTQFRVRGEPNDPSMIRNKLTTDIVNRMGIPTSYAGYV